jgi:Flp pilus assembly protein TadG
MPLLLTIIFAVIELGHAYNVQISVTHAAREAARSMAVTQVWSEAVDASHNSSPSLDPADLALTPSPATCSPGD